MKSLPILANLLAVLLTSGTVCAQNQTITLKDGTVFSGYISKQDNASRTGEVTYSRITRTLLVDDIQSRQTERRELGSLSKDWQDWARENDKVEASGGKEYLTLVQIVYRGDEPRLYYILVSGTRSLQGFSISEGVASFPMDQIASVRVPVRENTLLTDVNDVVQTDNATYTGVLLEQQPGVSVTIWNAADRSIHSLEYDEIRSIGKAAMNPDYSIWAQTPFLDRLNFKDSRTGASRRTEKGLIVENGLGESDNILFAVPMGDRMDTRQYSYKDVVSQERFRNEAYVPQYDVVLAEGESRLNRDSVIVSLTPLKARPAEGHVLFCVPQETSVPTVSDPKIVIETRLDRPDDVLVSAMEAAEVPLVWLGESQPVKRGRNTPEPTRPVWTFSSEQLLASSVNVDRTLSINGITRLEMELPAPGIYVVYLRKQAAAWVVRYQIDAPASVFPKDF